jgi:hypothetical protein
MTAQLKSWARALGGEVSGNSVRAPGPGHSSLMVLVATRV